MKDPVAFAQIAAQPHLTVICLRHGGTHLIKPFASEVSGLPLLDIFKSRTIEHRPNGPVLISLRDPRNVFVSQMRWKQRKRDRAVPAPGSHEADQLIARFIEQENPHEPRGRTAIECFANVISHWVGWPDAIRISFEELTGPKGSWFAALFAQSLGRSDIDAPQILAEKLGTGPTFTGQHSNFRDWFGPLAWAAWEKHGGPALIELMGYADAD